MPDIGHQWIGTRLEGEGVDLSVSAGVVITTGNNHTKAGSYTTLVASTAFDYAGLVLSIGRNSTFARHLVDIAIGAASSEQVILPDYYFAENGAGGYRQLFLPYAIPAGTRISARGQNSLAAGTNTMRIVVHGIAPNPRFPSPMSGRVYAYGVTAANTNVVQLDPGGTANTKGAWFELTASTSVDHSWLIFAASNTASGTTLQTLTATTNWLTDIGIGPSSEQVIVPNVPVSILSTRYPYTGLLWYPVNIPAGSRLVARCQCGINTAGERLFDVAAYCL